MSTKENKAVFVVTDSRTLSSREFGSLAEAVDHACYLSKIHERGEWDWADYDEGDYAVWGGEAPPDIYKAPAQDVFDPDSSFTKVLVKVDDREIPVWVKDE